MEMEFDPVRKTYPYYVGLELHLAEFEPHINVMCPILFKAKQKYLKA